MNIYLRELKAHMKPLIIWTASMALLIMGGMAKYSATLGVEGMNMNDLMKTMPKSLQNIFGVGVFDLSIALEYYAVLYMYIVLVAAVHGVMLGAGIIAKEERDRTVEYLMVKPVSRQSIITSKLLAALTNVAVFNGFIYAASFAMIGYYSEGHPYAAGVLKLSLGCFALEIFFLAMGAFFAALISRSKLSSAVSTGILLLTFMLAVIMDISGNYDYLGYLSPFKYFDAGKILKGGYNYAYPVLAALLTVSFISATYYFYKRRDLRM